MWELLVEPAKKFIAGGIDAFVKSEEYENLLIAVQDRVRREIRLNKSLFEEICRPGAKPGEFRHESNVRLELVRSLQTKAFDDTTSGGFPLSLFFGQKLSNDWFPKNWPDRTQYMEWIQKIETQHELFDRAYHRLKVIRSFAAAGKLHGDIAYINFLLIGAERSITRGDIDSRPSPARKKKWYAVFSAS